MLRLDRQKREMVTSVPAEARLGKHRAKVDSAAYMALLSLLTSCVWEEQSGLIASPSFESWYHDLKSLASLPASVPTSIKWG